jgi:two-component system, OmpR family, response regulator
MHPSNSPLEARKMRVLIADDSRILRRLITLSLTRVGGLDVIESADGRQAVELAQREHPDAVLLDVQMPGFDGPAVLASLSADPGTTGIPVVFLTAECDPSEHARLRALGARGVLQKPFDPETLPRDFLGALEES